jgi:hypothetical protein
MDLKTGDRCRFNRNGIQHEGKVGNLMRNWVLIVEDRTDIPFWVEMDEVKMEIGRGESVGKDTGVF